MSVSENNTILIEDTCLANYINFTELFSLFIHLFFKKVRHLCIDQIMSHKL